jgi:hypothetical protein
LAELLFILEVKLCSKTILTHIARTFSLELEMEHIHSIAKYRSNNTVMIYFIVANDNRQRQINLSILLALLLAMIIMKDRIAMISCIFSIIMIVM